VRQRTAGSNPALSTIFFDPCPVISVSCVDVEEGDGRVFSTEDIEPRQAWKGATVV
jgi:hypothetical protein